MFSPDLFSTPKSVSTFLESKKIDNSMPYPYTNPMLINTSAVLTPTSPQTFYVPSKSFEDTEYLSQSDGSPSSAAPMQSHFPNDGYNWFDISSMADTPNSAQSTIEPSSAFTSAKNIKEEIFNFEPEYIEFFQRYCDNPNAQVNDFEPEAEYVNYNETNCQSKSMCASPHFQPWINSSDSSSSKPSNGLPPISTISEQFPANYLDQNDFELVESGAIVTHNDVDFQPLNNFNFNQIAEVKSDREEKNIWQMYNIETNQPESPTDNIFIDEILDYKNEITVPAECEKISNIAEQNDADKTVAENKQWICQWQNCFKVYTCQSELVRHIEKAHIEAKKGDVFSCFWLDCAREHKPFNARYKLLIHMRVHSGEKPNKCQVSVSN